ncbi:MAG: hypothetical protein AAF125_24455 [Chloroflexota bacterium]
MNVEQSDIIRRETLFPMSEGEAHDFTDGLALSWIFSAALSAGLLMVVVTPLTTGMAAFSFALGGIWWTLSHLKRRRRR